MVSQSGSHIDVIRKKIQWEFEKARGTNPHPASKQMVRPISQNVYVEALYRAALRSLKY